MRPALSCSLIRRFRSAVPIPIQRRHLLTLAIETSCDDTSVAVLEKHGNGSATLHFHSKITSDNRSYGGVYPIVAHESHQKNLAALVNDALQSLPLAKDEQLRSDNTVAVTGDKGRSVRKKPDFITATRGPGMRASLITGTDTAKGLAVGWQVPFLGVNHMQAHALTPRLIAAIDTPDLGNARSLETNPGFPFLTLLVSGGHTMLVHSKGLCVHHILADTTDIAIGDMIDKCARDILPPSLLQTAPDVMYGPLLEKFAFPSRVPENSHQVGKAADSSRSDGGRIISKAIRDWKISTPYARSGSEGALSHADSFSFSGIGSAAKRVVEQKPDIGEIERRQLAQEVMRVAFEHLASRVLLALGGPEAKDTNTLVVSGGVASNQYLKRVLRGSLDEKGHRKLRLIFPPPRYCTDNAAMIAWTGIEMYEAGWRTDLSAMAVRKWAIDPKAEDGGILGIGGWRNVAPL
ncbi:tRNA N6-adenosine threonylcarbamoyltransferase, mitochondrial [Venustampulla echinocandica]|uniref:N(6)-L-threonylcarbamoyladenine synthase n=1 Tax=Venustampulla echinocandica TaxID=2656787 RepID=A0A370T903_9HELO|nr:tRNA N6-adenosine threonylcarbamoyltransferase, mitochondrial [Venustampulla echinocandica]RDL29957.1 tRNA N6-adenosine threonylcarbamoyltransferase, mitochondrial [Venustampulla echinocandica]